MKLDAREESAEPGPGDHSEETIEQWLPFTGWFFGVHSDGRCLGLDGGCHYCEQERERLKAAISDRLASQGTMTLPELVHATGAARKEVRSALGELLKEKLVDETLSCPGKGYAWAGNLRWCTGRSSMSAVSSVNCPVCGAEDGMMEDMDLDKPPEAGGTGEGEVFYHCHECGYGNLITIAAAEEGEITISWERPAEWRRYLKTVTVKDKHGLCFTGQVVFYPIGAEFDEYSVCPCSICGKLVWRLHSEKNKLLGEYPSLGAAFAAGDQYADRIATD